MSKLRSREYKQLSVRAADPVTEIFVVDSRFRRIASAVGKISVMVAPGIYKVRFRSGSQQKDKLVEVPADVPGIEIYGEPLEFDSAVPIVEIRTTRNDDLSAARDLSNEINISKGRGSQLFLFVRDIEEVTNDPPWTGVSLHKISGEHLCDFSDGIRDKEKRIGALNIEIDPGAYRLRVETGQLGTYEMFLVTVEGWQTQAFYVAESFSAGSESVRRIGLKTASVLMSRIGAGFNPQSDHIRLVELAKQGLQTGRNVVDSEYLRQMLREKFEDPMLGIYGAHLLLRAHRPRHTLINIVAGNLSSMIGAHPDVQALALRSGRKSNRKKPTFSEPPMLRSSWDLIVRSSINRMSTVPSGSISDQMSGDLMSSAPWLLYRVTKDLPHNHPVGMSFAEAKRILGGWIKAARNNEVRYILKMQRTEKSDFTSLEKRIMTLTSETGMLMDELAKDYVEKLPNEHANVSQLIRNIDAPTSSIVRSIESISQKLGNLMPS